MGGHSSELLRRSALATGSPAASAPVTAPPPTTGVLRLQQYAGNRAVAQKVAPTRPTAPPLPAPHDHRAFVESAIWFLETSAAVQKAGAPADEATVRKQLRGYSEMAENAEHIVLDRIGDDVLLQRLRAAYAKAVNATVTAAGARLKRLPTEILDPAAEGGELHPWAVPGTPVVDQRVNILSGEQAQYAALVAFVRKEVQELQAAAANPPPKSWLAGNANVQALLGLLTALVAELDNGAIRIRFTKPAEALATWDPLTETMNLPPVATAQGPPTTTALQAGAVHLLHEYVHVRGDRSRKARVAGGQRDVTVNRTQDVGEDVEAFARQAYWAQWLLARHSSAPPSLPKGAPAALSDSVRIFLDLERARRADATGKPEEATEERARAWSRVYMTYTMKGHLPSPMRYSRIDLRVGSTKGWTPVLTLVDGTVVELPELPPIQVTEQVPAAVHDHLLARVVQSAPYRDGRLAVPIDGAPPKTLVFVVFLRGRQVGVVAVPAPSQAAPAPAPTTP